MSAVYSSFHSIAGKHEKAGPVKTGGVDTDWLVAGRYVDELVKIDGDWKIKNRAATTDWTRVEPSNPNWYLIRINISEFATQDFTRWIAGEFV